jgi:hypothetical protein
MKIKACGFLAALMVLLADSNVDASPIATLTLQSQPGDFIGQGGTSDITYLPTNGFFFPEVRRTLPDGAPAELLFDLGRVTGDATNTFTLLFFGTDALGIPIQPGIYTNAERADFASPGHPGLDVSFQNRGCNTDTGSFVVTDATFGVGPPPFFSPTISSFSASFEQHCEGAAPALFGTFTYNANAQTEVLEPGGYSLVGIGMIGLFAQDAALRKSRKDHQS